MNVTRLEWFKSID